MEAERSRTRSTSAGTREVPLVWLPQFASAVGEAPEVPVPPEPEPEPPFAPKPVLIVTEPPTPPPPWLPPPTAAGVEPHAKKKTVVKETTVEPAMMAPKTSFFITSLPPNDEDPGDRDVGTAS